MMSRKVFISVLGTGNYLPSVYGSNDFKSTNTRFVQEATLEYLNVKDWTANDAVYILLTDSARTKNWENSINSKTGKPQQGLAEIIREMSLQCTCQDVSIRNGMVENEMWDIFQTLYGLVQDHDEVYIDLTHGFRYLPMLIVVFGNYAKFLKNVTIKHLSYGNYEAKREFEMEYAPFVDLLPLSVLQDWTAASADFLRNGNTTQLSELSSKTFNSRFKQNLDKEEKQCLSQLSTLVHTLHRLTESMRLCRGRELLQERWGQLQEQTELVKSSVTIPPLTPLIDKIESSFADFKPGKDIVNGYKAFLWCYKHQLYQQAVTILDETIITHMTQLLKKDSELLDDRTCVSEVMNSLEPNPNRKEILRSPEFIELQQQLKECEIFEKLGPLFWKLGKVRNNINHCGFLKNTKETAPQLVRKLEEYVSVIEEIVS